MDLTKNWKEWTKKLPGDSIDRNLGNKEMGDVDMLEVNTYEVNPFIIFDLKIWIIP